MLRRLLLVLLTLVLVVLLTAGGLLALLAWRPETLKGPIERFASERLGRELRIAGPLAVDLGRVTVVEAGGLSVAAPGWASAPTLAAVRHLRLGVDLAAWWRDGGLVITELRLEGPEVALERDERGRTSWPGGGEGEEGPAPPAAEAAGPRLPQIQDLEISDGTLAYRDARNEVAVTARLATTAPEPGSGTGGLQLEGEGRVGEDRATFALEIGSPLLLTGAGGPLPVAGELLLAGTRLRLEGEVREPWTLKGLRLDLDLASPEPGALLALLGHRAGEVPPDLSLRARLDRESTAFALTDLAAGWGESRLEGELHYDPAPERPTFAGRLQAPLLDLTALMPALADPAQDEAPAPDGTEQVLDLGPLAGHDGRLALTADLVRLPGIELRGLAAELVLAQGRLTVDPLQAGLAGGRIEGRIETADLTQAPATAALELAAEGVELAPLAALAALADPPAGRFTGTLAGTLRGTSVLTLLARSELVLDGRIEGLRHAGQAAEVERLEARLAQGRVTLDPLRLALPGGGLAGRIETGDLTTRPLGATLDLRAEGLDLALLAALAPQAQGLAGRFTGTLAGTLQGEAPADLLRESRLALEGTFAGLRYADLAAAEARLAARLEEGRLTLDPVRLDFPQGRVAGRVATAPLGEGFAGEIDLAAEAVDLAALLGEAGGLGGVLSGTLKGSVRGTTPEAVLAGSELAFAGQIAEPQLPRLGDRLGAINLEASLQPGGEEPLRLTATSRLGDLPLRIEAVAAELGRLLAGEGGLPVVAQAVLGETRARVEGALALPFEPERLDLALSIEGPNPQPVLALLELPALELPPYRLEGVLERRDQTISLSGLEGRVGDSDLAGELVVGLAGARPRVTGELRSAVLDLDDLGGLVGAGPGTGPGETAAAGQEAQAQAERRDGEVLPDEPLRPSRWHALDADVALRAAEVRAGRIPLDSFELKAVLEAGRLRIEPFLLRLGEGRMEGWMELDGREAPVDATLELDLSRLPVARLLNQLQVDTGSFGTLSGRARGGAALGGEGMSIAQILGQADGELTLLMEGGTLNRQLVTALGFDLLRLLGAVLGGAPQEVRLACAIADLTVRDGLVETRSLAIDTAVADLAGEGWIDLESEQIQISLLADPKGVAVPSGRTGVNITGTLADPQIAVDPGRLLARGAAAATFGLLLSPLTGLAAQLGGGQGGGERPCTGLLRQAPDGGG